MAKNKSVSSVQPPVGYETKESNRLSCEACLAVLEGYAGQFASGRDTTEIALELRRLLARCPHPGSPVHCPITF
jgi:hypothetical protein